MYNLKDFSPLSQNGADWTAAFSAAFDKAEATGGGTVFVPAGRYPTRSIRLRSHTVLHLDAGAVLDFLDDLERYEVVETQFEGLPLKAYQSLLHAENAEHFAITGFGTINGNGRRWWQEHLQGTRPYARPYLLHFANCRHITLENVTLQNSPSWTVHPLFCDGMTIQGIHIQNPPDSPNTDGIDPDGSRNLRITACTIDVGDDCIAIKSGTEDTPDPQPSENITVTGCTMLHGHGGVVIGSEMSGGVRNVSISGCVFYETDRGIRIKTRRRRGGVVENITVSSVVMEGVLCPFVFNMYYFCGKDGKMKHVWDKSPYPVDSGTPAIRDVQISNVIAKKVTSAAGFLYGLAEQPLENISFSHCTVEMLPGSPACAAMLDGVEPTACAGFFLRNAQGLSFEHMTLRGVVGREYDTDNTVEFVHDRSSYIIKAMETEDEIEGKGYVHYQSWQEADLGLVDAGYLQQLTLEKCTAIAHRWPDNILVAKDGDKVIGFVAYGPYRDDTLPGHGEIFAIYVLENYQGQRVGYELMNAALAKLSAYPKVAVWVLKGNTKAIRFYKRYGFRPDGTEAEVLLGTPNTELRLIYGSEEKPHSL